MKNDNSQTKAPRRGPGRGMPMGMPVEKAKDFKGTVKRLITYLKPVKMKLIVVFIFAIFSTVFTILGPKILGKATTKLFEGLMMRYQNVPGASIDFGYIGRIVLILVGLYLVSSLFQYIMQYIMASVAQKTVYGMREDVNSKISRLPLKYLDSKTHGEILSRVTNDMDNISNTLQQSMTQLITAVISLVGVTIMMLTISPLLTLITIVVLPMSVLITKKIASVSQKLYKKQQKILGELNGHVEEMYSGHKIVKVFNKEKDSVDTFEKLNSEFYKAAWMAQFISGIIMPLMNFVNNIGYILVSVGGGILVTRQAIAIGDVQAFISYSRQFGQPIVQTANIANLIQSTVASSERVFELLDETEEIPERENALESFNTKGHVTFENVVFGYSEDKVLMKDMNIHVENGQMVAIVGPTGAGKTTLVNLLMRFYDVNDGKIKIDDVNLYDIKRGTLRNLFGMVLQDTWLFGGTIRDNIAYGKEGASLDEIESAAKAAHAHHFIMTLPDGYDTILNEDANNISQGQRQLLTIARAILANPSIMILDEATSSVDTRTEVQIQKAMDNMMKGKTSFVIAHRLSTIKEADVILVMNEGDIIEKGTHKELLDKKGFYYDLYTSQFVGYKSE